MTLLLCLAGWCLVSCISAPLIGRMIAAGERRD
jgi:hypothetical protein